MDEQVKIEEEKLGRFGVEELKFNITGKELQVLNISLIPFQGIYCQESSVFCNSDVIVKTEVDQTFSE